MAQREYAMSIRCYFPGTGNNRTQHYPVMPLKDIPKWVTALGRAVIKAYTFMTGNETENSGRPFREVIVTLKSAQRG